MADKLRNGFTGRQSGQRRKVIDLNAPLAQHQRRELRLKLAVRAVEVGQRDVVQPGFVKLDAGWIASGQLRVGF